MKKRGRWGLKGMAARVASLKGQAPKSESLLWDRHLKGGLLGHRFVWNEPLGKYFPDFRCDTFNFLHSMNQLGKP